MSAAVRTRISRSGIGVEDVLLERDVLLIVAPMVGHIADRHDGVAQQSVTPVSTISDQARSLKPQLILRRIGIADAAQRIDDDRLVVPAGLRLGFRQSRRRPAMPRPLANIVRRSIFHCPASLLGRS